VIVVAITGYSGMDYLQSICTIYLIDSLWRCNSRIPEIVRFSIHRAQSMLKILIV